MAFYGKLIAVIRSVTCRMGLQCYLLPDAGDAPYLKPSQTDRHSIYLLQRD